MDVVGYIVVVGQRQLEGDNKEVLRAEGKSPDSDPLQG